MTRRVALWLTGLAALGLLAVLVGLDTRLHDAGGPGIVPFELAGSAARADAILAEWGPDGRDTARLSLRLDFAFLIAYGAFYALAAAAARDLARARGWSRLVPPAALVLAVPLGAALLDAVENVFLLLTIGDAGPWAPRLAAVFAGGKFVLTAATAAYVLIVLARGAAGAVRSR